jgi:hypothetical protein
MIQLQNGDKLMSLSEVLVAAREYFARIGDTPASSDVELLSVITGESPDFINGALRK